MGSKSRELFETLILGQDVPEVEERDLLSALMADRVATMRFCQLMLNERRYAREQLAETRSTIGGLEAELAAIREPPLFLADVLHVFDDGRLEVVHANRRQVVVAAPELDCAELRAGDEVLLNRDMAVAVAKHPSGHRTGTVAVVRDVLPSEHSAVVRTVGDEEMLAWCAPDVVATLESGDRVLLRRDSMCVIKKLPQQATSPFRLESAPEATFDSIGGLAPVIARIRNVLDLVLVHKDVARTFGIRLPAGMTLVGPPGVGKTLVARATANYLLGTGLQASFLNVKPGDLRAMYYGESEARVRELFAYARSLPGVVVIFLDEVESLGTREHAPGDRIDGRVLSSLLVEIDGLEQGGNIFIIAATNRLDLCDDALVRGGRLGTVIEHIPRPGREAAREILGKHLGPEIPYGEEAANGCAADVVDAAIGYLFAENEGPGVLATAVMANADRRDISARDVLSGALLKTVADEAKRSAALRRIYHGAAGGVLLEDVLEAVDGALTAERGKLKSSQAARRLLDFQDADQIVRVEVQRPTRTPRHRFLRVA